MVMILTYDGMKAVANATLFGIPFSIAYGLFKNDWTPSHNSTIAAVEPSDFPDYSGPLTVSYWNAPTLIGDRQVVTAPALLWSRGAGIDYQKVFGYYVIDVLGVLLWGELFVDGPIEVSDPGTVISVAPQFAVGSLY